MVLGNKCDVNDKRQVSKERGEKVIVILSDNRDDLMINKCAETQNLIICTDMCSVSVLLPSAGTGVRYQVHGDQCKGKHQC